MDLKKSYQLTRFRLVIVICIIALLIGSLLRFFSMIQASLEEMSVEINILTLHQMIGNQNLLSKMSNTDCSYIDKPQLFQFSSNKGAWSYDPKQHQLTYSVKSTSYFKSKVGQKIVIDLYCKKGEVTLNESSYQWCREMRVWGCGNW